MDELEESLRKQETHLASLQGQEAARQLNVISERDAIRRDRKIGATAACSSLIAKSCIPVRIVLEESPQRYTEESPQQYAGVAVSFSIPTKSPAAGAEAMLLMTAHDVLVSVDCRITPTSHTCQKCKCNVCDICCSTQR